MGRRKTINQLDLFSGIGGFHLGFERAGYKVNSYFSEIDKHAIAVYKQQFKNSKYVGSVVDIRGNELPRIDLITFGSPCQDFSLAGKREGMSGERSSLILEAIRLISECRPGVFIWENVKGTFSSNSGEDFVAILQAFTNIGGYRLEWQLLNTSWFLPQNRERIYLVGYSTKTKRNWRGVFPIGEKFRGFDERTREATNVRALVAGAKSGGRHSTMTLLKVKSATSKGYEVATEGDSINLSQPNSETRRGRVGKGKAQTLETSCNQAVVEPKIIGYTRDAKGKVTDRHLKDEAGTIHSSSGGGGNTDQFVQEQPMIAAQRGRYQEDGSIKQELEINKEGKSNTLTAVQKDDMVVEPKYTYQAVNKTIEKNLNAFKEGEPRMMDLYNHKVQDVSPCLVEPHHNRSSLFNGYRIRRLTPIECERLQGFPDNHTEYGNYDGEVKKMSNTQRYKQCGNAVTVDVVQAIAEKIKPLL